MKLTLAATNANDGSTTTVNAVTLCMATYETLTLLEATQGKASKPESHLVRDDPCDGTFSRDYLETTKVLNEAARGLPLLPGKTSQESRDELPTATYPTQIGSAPHGDSVDLDGVLSKTTGRNATYLG